ncbi:MAG: hypothetical protein ACOCP8_04430, partial [archaeon]
MPHKSSSTIWSKVPGRGQLVESNDFKEIKDAINKHRAWLMDNHSPQHTGSSDTSTLTGNFPFTDTSAGTLVHTNDVESIKDAINAFYYGDNPTGPFDSDTSSDSGNLIIARDLETLQDAVNTVETSCVACETCQFSTWTGNYSNWTNWTGNYSNWTNWTGNYGNWSNWTGNYGNW